MEKTFFVENWILAHEEELINEDGINCDAVYSRKSSFTAYTVPSQEYPIPMYIFKDYFSSSLESNLETPLYDLFGYFYISKTPKKNSSAIYYERKTWYSWSYSTTPPAANWTGNVVYVKSHRVKKGGQGY